MTCLGTHRSRLVSGALAGLAATALVAGVGVVPAAAADPAPLASPVAAALEVAVPLAPLTLTAVPTDPTRVATPVFTWTGGTTAYEWAITDPARATIHAGSGPETSIAPPAPLADGAYTFTVWEVDPVSQARGVSAAHGFTVDTSPPPPPRITSRPAFPTTVPTPAFGVADIEPGAVASWQVVAAGGVPVQGPEPVSAPTVTLAALAPGSYIFQIRQSDPAGNSSVASEPFAIVAPAVVPPATVTRTRLVLPKMNVKRLRPVVGTRVRTVRPTLRWTRGPKGTTLYNVQVFRVGGRTAENAATVRLSKLRSVFPRTRRVRVAGLKRGQCYVWRVWPYIGSRFASRPLGVSNFCVAPNAKAPRRAPARR